MAKRNVTLVLNEFTPFRLNRLADAVSQNLADIYRSRFKLEIPEWRILVTVGLSEDRTAQTIVFSTRMHKTRVSRAVASLLARGLIERITSIGDEREWKLRLTKAGQRLYAELVPLALEREGQIFSCLSLAQRATFARALSRLEQHFELNE